MFSLILDLETVNAMVLDMMQKSAIQRYFIWYSLIRYILVRFSMGYTYISVKCFLLFRNKDNYKIEQFLQKFNFF